MQKDEFLKEAEREALIGLSEGGIPIGGVLVHRGKIVARGRNRRVQQGSAVLHGEIDTLMHAGRHPASFYKECTLYTTLSPCIMCSGAIALYKIPRVVIGEDLNFSGEIEFLRSRNVEVTVVNDPELIRMMKKFIEENPEIWNEDIAE